MQGYADTFACLPTPGDHLEQMKGQIDKPGQTSKELVLVVLIAEHTIEEAKFANIHLAGNFLAPIASRYRERIDVEAILAAGETKKLKSGTVYGAWRQTLEGVSQSGAFARISDSDSPLASPNATDRQDVAEDRPTERSRGNDGKARTKATSANDEDNEPASLNKVLHNKGDPAAVREAKVRAKKGEASLAARNLALPSKTGKKKRTGLPPKNR